MRKPVFGVPTRTDTNRAVQLQKMSRSTQFWIKQEEGVYHPCSENKGADQLRSSAFLFSHICKKPVFSRRGSFSNLFLYVTNVLRRPYRLDESAFNFRGNRILFIYIFR